MQDEHTNRAKAVQLEGAAAYAGMSVHWLRKRIYAGELPAYKLGTRVVVLLDDLDALIEAAPRA